MFFYYLGYRQPFPVLKGNQPTQHYQIRPTNPGHLVLLHQAITVYNTCLSHHRTTCTKIKSVQRMLRVLLFLILLLFLLLRVFATTNVFTLSHPPKIGWQPCRLCARFVHALCTVIARSMQAPFTLCARSVHSLCTIHARCVHAAFMLHISIANLHLCCHVVDPGHSSPTIHSFDNYYFLHQNIENNGFMIKV